MLAPVLWFWRALVTERLKTAVTGIPSKVSVLRFLAVLCLTTIM